MAFRGKLPYNTSVFRNGLTLSRQFSSSFAAKSWPKDNKVVGVAQGTPRSEIGLSGLEVFPSVQQANASSKLLNFRDAKVAYRNESSFELIRSILVFKACSMKWLVNIAPNILKFAEKAGIEKPIYAAIKHTFYKQFCAGERAGEVHPVISKLERSSVGTVLDLSIEVDKDKSVGDERCDEVKDLILECIDATSVQEGSFAAIKVTSLAPPSLLQKMSQMLTYIKTLFAHFDKEKNGKVNLHNFTLALKEMGYGLNDEEIIMLFNRMDKTKDGEIDYIEFTQSMQIDHPSTKEFLKLRNRKNVRITNKSFLVSYHDDTHDIEVATPKGADADVFPPPKWSDNDISKAARLFARMDEICERAIEKKVRIMVDAEQSYFQPAIDNMAQRMQRKYNKSEVCGDFGPVVYNTYQMYLKDSYDNLTRDMEISKREGWKFGAKLVRGAYMVAERELAKELGTPSPVHETKENTDKCFDSGVTCLLEEIKNSKFSTDPNRKVSFMVASHNENSVKMTCKQMEDFGISRDAGNVYFGQLMGMCNHISMSLGFHDYGIKKYVPYGPLKETIPYLIRRAQENSDVLSSTEIERSLMLNELRRRVGLGFLNKPVADQSISNAM
eukprot:Nk52_evm5s1762 gene=Nk52_evmTU5s1762